MYSVNLFCTEWSFASICFRMFCSKHSSTLEHTYLLSSWFHCVDIFYIKFKFREIFTVMHSVTWILLIETLDKCIINYKCWFNVLKNNINNLYSGVPEGVRGTQTHPYPNIKCSFLNVKCPFLPIHFKSILQL